MIVARLWRSVKYEKVYLHAYASVPEARASLGRYLTLSIIADGHIPRLTAGHPIRLTSTDSFWQRHNQPAGNPLINRAGLFKQTETPLGSHKTDSTP